MQAVELTMLHSHEFVLIDIFRTNGCLKTTNWLIFKGFSNFPVLMFEGLWSYSVNLSTEKKGRRPSESSPNPGILTFFGISQKITFLKILLLHFTGLDPDGSSPQHSSVFYMYCCVSHQSQFTQEIRDCARGTKGTEQAVK